MMLTTDYAWRILFTPTSKRFHDDLDAFAEAFAKAWFKLTHRDMGPYLVTSDPTSRPKHNSGRMSSHPAIILWLMMRRLLNSRAASYQRTVGRPFGADRVGLGLVLSGHGPRRGHVCSGPLGAAVLMAVNEPSSGGCTGHLGEHQKGIQLRSR